MHFERKLLEIIRGEKKAPVIMAAMAAISSVYRCVLAARNFAYDRGWLPSARLPAVVVSVGNIVVGGTGKTPLVHLLASELQQKVRLAILTRGFRSHIEKSGTIEKISSESSPGKCGDEPYFLLQKTKAHIWVGADRVASGRLAIREGAKCLLLDDGMQHRRLKRDIEIVVVDGTDPFSQGRFLPWGLLRDSPKRLRNADLVVATHVKDLAQLKLQLSRWTSAPLVAMRHEVISRNAMGPRKVGVFCGIGQPKRFLETVRDLKSEIVDTLILEDHGCLQKGQLEKFAEQCRKKGAEALVCTEKDFVKLSHAPSGFSTCLKIEPIEIELKITAGKEHWEKLMANILERIGK
jgi:tetraacyldisaccharide 4'-kinase